VLLARIAHRVAHPLLTAWWWVRRARLRAAKCVLTHGGAVLLVRHTYGDRLRWDLPGGLVRRREQPLAAARRELREELGVELDVLHELGAMELRIHGRHDLVHYFHGELPTRGIAPNAAELRETGWFEHGSLPRRLGRHVERAVGLLAETR
jgi:8-oxo-dGTP pyrophosphatase MutT (NUDIX family)